METAAKERIALTLCGLRITLKSFLKSPEAPCLRPANYLLSS